MTYTERLRNVSVLGAGGKMGSGIVLLTALEMFDLSQKEGDRSQPFVLQAIDISPAALSGLMPYLQAQIQKVAEKNIVRLRQVYRECDDLIENSDIIARYIADVLNIVRPATVLEAAYGSTLIFEAIVEDMAVKTKVLSKINTSNPNSPWFFSNTSAIPIHELDKKAGLGGRILGFHFYNPPAVQKLVELISAKATLPELLDFAGSYAKNLRKTIVPANDFAGFIGNGHFMRDFLYASSEIDRLQTEATFAEAVYMINRVSQDFLLRPMGIFQLCDYVGLDVCQLILRVMDPYVAGENLHSPLLDELIAQGVRGGQFPDGSQKDGFFKYEKNRPTAIYDPKQKGYLPLANLQSGSDDRLGPLPSAFQPWKAVIALGDKDTFLQAYFGQLRALNTRGAQLAKAYGLRCREIGLQLVSQGVANREGDVNAVLTTGFYHAYGPVNNYFSEVNK
jgi:3-hydroxyacyl-CoA dehydrogenase